MDMSKIDLKAIAQRSAKNREKRREMLERLRNRSLNGNFVMVEEADTIDNDTSEEVEE